MSSFQEKLAMWQAAATPLTPEAQERKLREEREKQRQAVKIAKARVARYNMTLRALAIKSVRDQTEEKRAELEKVREAQTRASRYNMTSRALTIVANKNQRNVARAFDPTVSPGVAKDMIRAVATHQAMAAQSITDPEASEKQQLQAAAKALEVPEMEDSEDDAEEEEEEQEEEEEEEEATVEEEEEEETAEEEEEEAEPKAAADEPAEADEDQAAEEEEGPVDTEIVMEELAAAVAEGDEDGVNRAILKEFLEEHAPHRVDEVDELLKQYAGSQVSVLFEELIEEYPDPAEAIVAGESKALEAAKDGAVEDDETEEDGEEEEEEELNAVDQARRDAEQAEKREKARIAAMTDAEREMYLAEKEEERRHAEKKDEMLKQQLNLYSKGGSKTNPVLSAMGTRRGASKRVSKRLEGEEKKKREPSVVGEGFILSASAAAPAKASEGVSTPAPAAKWAVNVQPQLLRERMKKAGVADKDIEALMAEESDML